MTAVPLITLEKVTVPALSFPGVIGPLGLAVTVATPSSLVKVLMGDINNSPLASAKPMTALRIGTPALSFKTAVNEVLADITNPLVPSFGLSVGSEVAVVGRLETTELPLLSLPGTLPPPPQEEISTETSRRIELNKIFFFIVL